MKSIIEIIKTGRWDENYEERCRILDGMLLHSRPNNRLLKALLDKTFPTELEAIKKYRLSVFTPITKTYFDKVLLALRQFYYNNNFSYYGDTKKELAFLEEPYGGFSNFFDWGFNVAFRYFLEDANGWFLTLPSEVWVGIDTVFRGDEYIAPIITDGVETRFFYSNNVLVDKPGFLLLRYYEGYIFVSLDGVSIYRQQDGRFVEEVIINTADISNAPGLAVRSMGNVVREGLYESYISGVCPFWTQALIEFSDKQAALKQHVYPEKWRIESSGCNTCKGTGVVIHQGFDGNEFTSKCGACDGTGRQPTGMYSEIVISKDIFSGDVKPPFVGYLEKDLSPVEFISNDINANIYAGLSAINMEYLMDVPLNQSGVAKELDRSDVAGFIRVIGEVFLNTVLTGILQGYNFLLWVKSSGVIDEYRRVQITFNIPDTFSYTSRQRFSELVKEYVGEGGSPWAREAVELARISHGSFWGVEQGQVYELGVLLTPFPGASASELLAIFTAGGMTLKEFRVYSNILFFIRLAIEKEGRSFLKRDKETQLDIIFKIYETYKAKV